MGRDMWYSVTPEAVAKHIALRVAALGRKRLALASLYSLTLPIPAAEEVAKSIIVLDAFGGVGGNTIQFASVCSGFVISTDISLERLIKLQQNSSVYEVSSQVDCVVADACRLPFRTKSSFFDVAFLSPPWGGPKYSKTPTVRMDPWIQLGRQMLRDHLAASVIYYLPRNTDLRDLIGIRNDHLPMFIEGYLNRGGKLTHVPSDLQTISLRKDGGDKAAPPFPSLSTVLSTLWSPNCSSAWSWNLSVVTVYVGALANQAVAIVASQSPPRLTKYELSQNGLQLFRSVWSELRCEITHLLGSRGQVRLKGAQRSKTTGTYEARPVDQSTLSALAMHEDDVLQCMWNFLRRCSRKRALTLALVKTVIRGVIDALVSCYIEQKWQLVQTLPNSGVSKTATGAMTPPPNLDHSATASPLSVTVSSPTGTDQSTTAAPTAMPGSSVSVELRRNSIILQVQNRTSRMLTRLVRCLTHPVPGKKKTLKRVRVFPDS